MTNKSASLSDVTVERSEEEKTTQGGMVELSLADLHHVSGGGFVLSERPDQQQPNGFVLSE